MVKIKSFLTNNGDMFYIKHGSDNFTIIDCCMDDYNKKQITDEIKNESLNKGIQRFISTHPDDDHIRGLKYLDENFPISNFYCVKNNATKQDVNDDFKKYCELRDSDKKSFYLSKDCSRKWMNKSDNQRGSSGINIKWPDINNDYYKQALEKTEKGGSPNNISPIITYSLSNNITIYWFGDLETDYIDNIKNDVNWIKADVIFAPHHGRSSGKIPNDILEKIDPRIIIIGNAPSEDLDYYQKYETITQNSAEDIVIICDDNTSDFYVSNSNYTNIPSNLKIILDKKLDGYKYIGSLKYDE